MAKKKLQKQRTSLKFVLGKLDQILDQHKLMIKQSEDIARKEDAAIDEEKKVEQLEQRSLDEIKNLEKLEQEIKENVEMHPLKNVTFRDVARGAIGALVGIIVHNTIIYGPEFGASLDYLRASILFPLSFAVGATLIYATGFRKIKDKTIFYLLPIRAITIYIVAILVVILVFTLFNPEFGYDFGLSYKQVAAGSLSATVGAATADLIGRD